jgi:hypothetical protein
MQRRSLTTKLLSLFLVAFVCLNAGGALCVAYCQSSFEASQVSKDHCPLKKKSQHCDPDQQKQDSHTVANIGGIETDCCPMTVSFIAGPMEKSSFSVKAPPTALIAAFESAEAANFTRIKINIPTAYRGPPLDQRISRLKNGVIRI